MARLGAQVAAVPTQEAVTPPPEKQHAPTPESTGGTAGHGEDVDISGLQDLSPAVHGINETPEESGQRDDTFSGNLLRKFRNVRDAISELFRIATSRSGHNKVFVNFAQIDEDVRSRLERDTGLNLQGVQAHGMDESFVRHAVSRHGESNEIHSGQPPVTAEDFQLIPEIVRHYDKAKLIGKNAQGKPLIRYRKKSGDIYYHIEEVRSGQEKLAAVTMYKNAGSTAARGSSIGANEDTRLNARSVSTPLTGLKSNITPSGEKSSVSDEKTSENTKKSTDKRTEEKKAGRPPAEAEDDVIVYDYSRLQVGDKILFVNQFLDQWKINSRRVDQIDGDMVSCEDGTTFFRDSYIGHVPKSVMERAPRYTSQTGMDNVENEEWAERWDPDNFSTPVLVFERLQRAWERHVRNMTNSQLSQVLHDFTSKAREPFLQVRRLRETEVFRERMAFPLRVVRRREKGLESTTDVTPTPPPKQLPLRRTRRRRRPLRRRRRSRSRRRRNSMLRRRSQVSGLPAEVRRKSGGTPPELRRNCRTRGGGTTAGRTGTLSPSTDTRRGAGTAYRPCPGWPVRSPTSSSTI